MLWFILCLICDNIYEIVLVENGDDLMMNKEEFLKKMKESLYGEVSDIIISDNIYYYRNYIETEISNGKSESEVLDMLGDPRLLAKTIIELQGVGNSPNSFNDSEYSSYAEEQERVYRSNTNSDAQNGFSFSKIKGCLLGIIILIVIITIFAFVLQVALYFAVPIAIVVVVMGLIKKLRQWHDYLWNILIYNR